MPAKKESRYPDDWLEKAEKDMKRVYRCLRDSDLEDASFHLQQAIEKYLKAFLLSKGWKLKYIHDLERLLDEAIEYNPNLEKFREFCIEVSPYYTEDRYPFLPFEPIREDIERVLKQAEELIP